MRSRSLQAVFSLGRKFRTDDRAFWMRYLALILFILLVLAVVALALISSDIMDLGYSLL